MNNSDPINKLATELLHDIEVSRGYAHPDQSRRQFEFLLPHYTASREMSLIERIIEAYNQLETEKQSIFRAAVLEAMERCLNEFRGSASRLLDLIELNHRLNRDALSSQTWSRLIDCRNADNPQLTTRLLEGLVRKFREWDITPDIRSISWKKLVSEVSIAELPTAGEWLLGLARHAPEDAIAIFHLVWARLNIERLPLGKYWSDREEIYDALFAAFLSDISVKERAMALRSHGLPVPGEVADCGCDELHSQLQAANDKFFDGFTTDDLEVEAKFTQLAEA